MATALDIPIRLHTPAEYRAMSYNELLNQLNTINSIQKYIPAETYNIHRALIGSLMQNMQRRACIQAYADQIAASEAHIAQLEAILS